MDRAQDLVQTEPMLHGQHKFGQQLSGVLTDDGGAQDSILARVR